MELEWRLSGRLDGLDVTHAPGCPRPRPDYSWSGWAPGGASIGRLVCSACGSGLDMLDDAPVVTAPPGNLPGGLAWATIERAYHDLAGRPAGSDFRGRPFRRRRPDVPSRPEVAHALGTSPATLRRACEWHGRGAGWPPLGI